MITIVINCEKQTDNSNIEKTIKSFKTNDIEIILINAKYHVLDDVRYINEDTFEQAFLRSIRECHEDYYYIVDAGDCFYEDSFKHLINSIKNNNYDLVHFNIINHKNHYQVEKAYNNGSQKSYSSLNVNSLPIKIKGIVFKTVFLKNIKLSHPFDHSFELDILSQVYTAKELQCYRDSSCVLELYNESDIISFHEELGLSTYLKFILAQDTVNKYQEYLTLNELKKYLVKSVIKYNEEYLSNNDKKQLLNSIHIILSKISIEAIKNMSSIIMPYKNYLLDLKYGKQKIHKYIDTQEKKSYIYYQDNPVLDIKSIGYFKINILESKKNILILDGVDMFSILGDKYQLEAVDNENNYYHPQLFKWTLQDRKGFVGETVFEGRRFRFEIPLNGIKHIRFILKNGDNEYELNPSFGRFAKLVKKYKMSFFAKDNYIFQYRKNGISIRANTKKNLLKSELKFWMQLAKLKRFDLIGLRLAYYIMNTYYKKPIWLMRDNEKRAKDSGAEMFKYFSTWNKRNDYHSYFILDKDCSDYVRMRQYGKIIQPDSFKYKLYHLLADKLIDTRGSISPEYIFKDDYVFLAGLCDWDYIWLIHGIMTRNESTWTNKYAINAKLFATCNVREYQSVLEEDNGYGYSKDEVALTGLPRHDALNAHKQKKILFLPTWRKHLAGDLIPGTSDRSYVDNFKESDFFQFYNSLINDSRLLKTMKEKGYTGDFYLHPSFMKQCHDFDENEYIHVGKEAADTNKLIGECSILLTDYSSAQFEGAYLDTPVIYPQYDADTFSDNHTGQEGYFDYEKDGFGPVCYDLDTTVKTIINYLNSDCKNIDPYKSRAKNFFTYHDHCNSERVFNQILKIDHQYDNTTKIVTDEENVYLYQGNILKNAVKHDEIYKLYNPLFHLNSFVKKIEMKEHSFNIDACLIIDDRDFTLPHEVFQINIGPFEHDIQFSEMYYKKNQKYCHFQLEVDYKDILLTKKSTPIYITWKDSEGFGYRGYLKYQFAKRDDSLANKKNRKLHYSNIHILKEVQSSIFVRETMGNNVYLCVRDINVTDTAKHQKMLKKAYLYSRLFWLHKAKNSILLFEKFSSKYEESASVLFEKLIDEGYRNVYFIIDKDSLHYQNIPNKYKKYIIEKYSFKHYFYFFMSRKFISTESMNHCIELNIADPNVTLKITKGAYDYVFLQHGVMYMYCLENRSDFIKGQGFTKNSKIVVSSQTEANHFIEYGGFNQNDLIISGLPKFDKNTKNSDADKILIMPTSRDFEYNVIRLTPTKSTYYRFVKKIIDSIPNDLKDKIIVVGHPLLKDQLESTDLKQYMPTDYVYNELLKETKLLITDYSSISYDAFYRGCNVVFCWEDKEMCLSALGYKLMLNDNNVFADVSYSFDDLADLVRKNYYSEQTLEHINKYRDIVTYHDGCNTQRCYESLKQQGYLDKQPFKSIRCCTIQNFTKKVYSGDKRIHTQLEIYDGNKLLVKNRDYQICYFNNKHKGRFALAFIIGRGRYFGIRIKRFKICDTIINYSVYGIRRNQGIIDLEQIAVCNKKGHYLKKNIDFKIEKVPSEVNHVTKIVIQGIKKYAGKINLMFYEE